MHKYYAFKLIQKHIQATYQYAIHQLTFSGTIFDICKCAGKNKVRILTDETSDSQMSL